MQKRTETVDLNSQNFIFKASWRINQTSTTKSESLFNWFWFADMHIH